MIAMLSTTTTTATSIMTSTNHIDDDITANNTPPNISAGSHFLGKMPITQETEIKDSETIERLVSLVEETKSLLVSLNADDVYGSISWPNSLTIDHAIEKLDAALNKYSDVEFSKSGEIVKITVGVIREYEVEVVEYFSTYISDDLNKAGRETFKRLKQIQDTLFKNIYNGINV